jgi:hypothetical protein
MAPIFQGLGYAAILINCFIGFHLYLNYFLITYNILIFKKVFTTTSLLHIVFITLFIQLD